MLIINNYLKVMFTAPSDIMENYSPGDGEIFISNDRASSLILYLCSSSFTRRHPPIQGADKVKKQPHAASQKNHFPYRFPHLFLPVHLLIGEIDSQQTPVDHAMEISVRQGGDAQVCLRIKMGNAGNHFLMILIVGAKVKVAAETIFILVNQVI